MHWHTAAARLAAGFASLALLGGCAAGATPSPVPTPSPSTALVVPTASPSPSPLGTPSPAPSVSEQPTSDLAWHSIGAIPVRAANIPSLALVGFARGYVAVERGSRLVRFSADGRTWRAITLPFKVTKDASGNSLDAGANAVTTNGTQVLVVGGYSHTPCAPGPPMTGGGPGCPLYPVAWVSDDGVTWQSAYPGPRPSDPPGYDQGSEFVAAWPVPTGGWDAALSYWQGESLHGRDLWHSGDGIRWTRLEPAPAPTPGFEGSDKFPWVHAGAADAEGIRVLWQGWSDFTVPLGSGAGVPVMTLATSPDGRSWTTVDGFAGRGTEIGAGVAPAGDHSRWVLAGASGIIDDYSTAVPTVWTSEDRVHWTATLLPIAAPYGGGRVNSIVLTPAGYVAVGTVFDQDGGADNWTSLSEDGLTWVELPPVGTPGADRDPASVADGPAGVIGLGAGPTGNDEAAVWQLR
jgi:hypothetical protein